MLSKILNGFIYAQFSQSLLLKSVFEQEIIRVYELLKTYFGQVWIWKQYRWIFPWGKCYLTNIRNTTSQFIKL